jgi:hypothetical protein
LRIAEWNLERSGIDRTSRIPGQLDVIRRINADVWILTETHSAIALDGYYPLVSMRDPNYHQEGESCVTIWSRWPMRSVSIADPALTVCADLHLPSREQKMLVYGTVIPYGGDGVSKRKALPWERHRAAVQLQTAEWLKLRELYRDHALCVAGDFNANLDGTRWYGVNDAKNAIRRGLVAAGMSCATEADLRAPPFEMTRATVNHICLSDNLHGKVEMKAWEGTENGRYLSDHNGVLVDLEIQDP